MIKELKVEELFPHPENPRKDLGDLTELTESIRKNGIYQNLTVVPRQEGGYTVVIGHRRLAAAKAAGLKKVPAAVVEMDPMKQIETMLIENLQRADLTVYEQARSFQMMLDLGSDIDSISEKTGFSKTTVRRRVKMGELDQKKLQEISVSGRQLRLEDFDRLAEVKDKKTRNKVLGYIGTADFDLKVKRAITDQKIKEMTPKVLATLKEMGCQEITQQQAWSYKFEMLPGCWRLFIPYFGEENKPDGKLPKKKCYYRLGRGEIYFYRELKQPEKVEDSEEVKAEKRRVRDAWKKLDDFGRIAYELRREFVMKLKMTKTNREAVLTGAAMAYAARELLTASANTKELARLVGVDDNAHYGKQKAQAVEGISQMDKHISPEMVYALFGDSAYIQTKGYGRADAPVYEQQTGRIILYKWLEMVGYEISTEEKAVLDGTSDLFEKETK